MGESDAPSVAVVGLGIAGLVTVKDLKEVGFNVTGFDQSNFIGGLWQYSDDARTSVMPTSHANISKEKFAFTDFPYPDDVPWFPNWSQVMDYLHAYAYHFSLNGHFRLNHQLRSVVRFKDQWELEFLDKATGKVTHEVFDKLVMCTGNNNIPLPIKIDGLDKFEGQILNSRTCKRLEDFKNKNVLFLGFGSTTADTITSLFESSNSPKELYVSHRRGLALIPLHVGGKPWDRSLTFQRMATNALIAARDKTKMKGFQNQLNGLLALQDKAFEIDPAWGFENVPLVVHKQPIIGDEVYEPLKSGAIKPVAGVKRVVGPKSIELTDGRVLEDIDILVISAGYRTDYSVLGTWDPTRNTSPEWSKRENNNGRPLPRLYQGIFSLDFPESLAYNETFNFSTSANLNSDLAAMALAQVWLGNSSLPSQIEMNKSVDEHHEMLLRLTETDQVQPFTRNGWAWGDWCQTVAGCGLHERLLGWGFRGWWFWLWNRKLYKLLKEGLWSPASYRLFPSRKRPAWAGARAAIEKANAMANA